MFPFNKSYFPKQKFVFALSGGIDSIAACHFLKKGNYDFIAAHFNHKFIPQDDEIAESVIRFCYKNEIPLFVIDSNKKYESGSKEDFCRKERYAALGNFVEKNGLEILVTAHHLDDCVESYFLNFLKGCPEYVPINYSCKYPNFLVVRPFLLNKKVDFGQYVMYHGLEEFVMEDELNGDLSLMRNWTRNVVLPTIEQKYKGLSKVVFKKMKRHLDDVVKEM